jgi:hypothetical protein
VIKGITGTRSYIHVEFDNKTIWIEGELTLTPAFYADKRTMKILEKPEYSLSEEEKGQIVSEVLQHNSGKPVKIFFEE